MNYAQKYDLFFQFFIKVVVNKSKAYSFLINGMMHLQKKSILSLLSSTPGIRPNASGAATVSPDGKQVGKNFITNLIIIIKVCYLLYFL